MNKTLLIMVMLLGMTHASENNDFDISLKPIAIFQIAYDYNQTDNIKNNIRFRKLGIGLNGKISNNSGFRVLTIQKGDYRGIYDAFGYTKFQNINTHYKLTFGQFKPPFGMERNISFFKRDFINDSHVSTYIQPRDIGASLNIIHKYISLDISVINGGGWKRNEENSSKDILSRLIYKKNNYKFGGALYLGNSGPDSLLLNKNRYSLQGEIMLNYITFRSELLAIQENDNHPMVMYLQGVLTHNINIEKGKYLHYTFRIEKFIDDQVNYWNDKYKITSGINIFHNHNKLKTMINYELINGLNGYKNAIYIGIQFGLW